MPNVKIVIGANYGDEGKGLMTDYFAAEAESNGLSCIVVCHNGGPQRGHTVLTPSGLKHVFQHFGSGTFAGAHTYLSEKYLVNPMTYRVEYEKLNSITDIQCFIDPDCLLTLPYDMLINQIAENRRGENKHGSCGMGIWETEVRAQRGYDFKVKDILDGGNNLVNFIKFIRNEYLPNRLSETGVNYLTCKEQEIITNDNLILNYVDDTLFMLQHSAISTASILGNYQSVIFESGQGLLLDEKYSDNPINTTASNTGLQNPIEIIKSIDSLKNSNIEACYVTRSYMTRHGAGFLPNECSKNDINGGMFDTTNIPNEFQGTIRYGKLDIEKLIKRVNIDFKQVASFNAKLTLALTHLNEYNILFPEGYCGYISNGQIRNSISRLGV